MHYSNQIYHEQKARTTNQPRTPPSYQHAFPTNTLNENFSATQPPPSLKQQNTQRGKPFFPIQLLIEAKTRAQILTTSRHVIEFFDLDMSPHLSPQNHHSNQPSEHQSQRNKLIKCLDFIRFSNNSQTPPTHSSREDGEDECFAENSPKIRVPSLSFILLANTNRQNVLNDAKLSKNTWSYHHQVELNDERGATIAKQIFFQLNSSNSPQFPLCCRSNWVSPLNSTVTTINTQQTGNAQKYIVRLNVNCKNYELMIFFYRLLFDKCKNYSKKDFSVFVLSQTDNIEMQLSLKQHNLTRVHVEHMKCAKLVYNIVARESFENILRLLDGFVEEIVKNRVYTVLDPDRNRIFLVDCSAQQRVAEAGLGLGEVYFSSLSVCLFLS